MKSKIIIGSDHAGFSLKEILKKKLHYLDYMVEDVGVYEEVSVHYPTIAQTLVSQISSNNFQKGILICGTGIGMSISANRIKGIRACLCHDEFTAEMSRKHNNANILIFGSRVIKPEIAEKALKIWLNTEFEAGRHEERIQLIDNIF